jgi:hypothetical protein
MRETYDGAGLASETTCQALNDDHVCMKDYCCPWDAYERLHIVPRQSCARWTVVLLPGSHIVLDWQG